MGDSVRWLYIAKVPPKLEEAEQVVKQRGHLIIKFKPPLNQCAVSPIGMLKAPGSTAYNYSQSYYNDRRYGTDDELRNLKRVPAG